MTNAVENLHRKRTGLLDRREAIVKSAINEGRGLTAAEKASDNALAAEARLLGDTISRAEQIQRGKVGLFLERNSIEVREAARPAGWTFAACLLSIAGSALAERSGIRDLAPARFAEESLRDFQAAAALSASTVAGGGGMIHEDVSADFIDALRARAVVRAAGARIEPMPLGNLDIEKITADPVTTWQGEQQTVNGTAPTFGQKKLLAKKLRVTMPVSASLVRYAGERAVQNVLDSIRRAMATAEDAAFLRGTGTQYAPQGLSKQAGSSASSAGSPTISSVESETAAAVQAVLNANSRMVSPCWIWAPRTTLALGSQRIQLPQGNPVGTTYVPGEKAWPEINLGRFRGFPFLDTTSIPTNLGAGTDSEVYFADFDDIVIGQGPIEVRRGTAGIYVDSTGATQSAFVRDEVILDIVEYVDLGVRHTGSIYLLSGVEYVPGM